MTSERAKAPRSTRADDRPARSKSLEGLEAANAVFRDAYAAARDRSAYEVPILIVLADHVILRHGRRRIALRFTPQAFHPLKGAAHVIAALLSLLAITPEGTLDGESRGRLETMQRAIDAARPQSGEEGESIARALELALDLCADVARESRLDRARLATSARKARLILLELTEKATRLNLQALHSRVQELLNELSPGDRRALHVVVAGDHQARRRSLGMQYFERRLPAVHGTGERVIYGESVASEEDAVTLVGICRVDRQMAEIVFGDPDKLQQDVLGDATKKELEGLDLTPIG